ncbi:hypothetical protein AJ85_17955 [Alkalihalobacillus alcalophilus ATCC 27647 = CGMCC 1.3604]|uniref:Uncharacterized protein n=1 Tax=Alkalihalobacillus alcalophilus ATCC 27647 = CGMCC 1.3604 TaxID=1218173 RepID=A0A4V3X894_ALKAL|nr:hypothetical protein AJ85_17955 [Alkalihalobacillus alcalophilus ATCC 27647 = CGMCC 1.3604]
MATANQHSSTPHVTIEAGVFCRKVDKQKILLLSCHIMAFLWLIHRPPPPMILQTQKTRKPSLTYGFSFMFLRILI